MRTMFLRTFAVLTLALLATQCRCTLAVILLYPPASVLQLTSSLSAPLAELPPMRKLFFDWGFQMNYNFPVELSSFYNAPIWPWQQRRQSRANVMPVNNSSGGGGRQHHRNDFTAGELYAGLQRALEHHGFERSCLLLSVCELAQQPLIDGEVNLLSEVLRFMLSPLLHGGFAGEENGMRQSFELAERRGHSDGDCRCWYANCTRSPLELFSKIIQI